MNTQTYYRVDSEGYMLCALYLTPEEAVQQGVTLQDPPPLRPTPLEPGLAEKWEAVRRSRSGLLAATDWTQLPDVAIETKEAWAVYRQALRDVTKQPDPEHIVWPIAPTRG
jgi:uncharacterized protein YjiS (DUF1127 family)